MKMKINLSETGVINGYFCVLSEKPYKATGCNYNEADGVDADLDCSLIHVGYSTYIDGVFAENKEAYEAALYPAPTQEELDKSEMNDILNWLDDNDYIINKHTLGEYTDDNPKWTAYLSERAVKLARYNELEAKYVKE